MAVLILTVTGAMTTTDMVRRFTATATAKTVVRVKAMGIPTAIVTTMNLIKPS